MVSVFTSGYVNTETILHFFIIIVVIIIFYVVWSNLKRQYCVGVHTSNRSLTQN